MIDKYESNGVVECVTSHLKVNEMKKKNEC